MTRGERQASARAALSDDAAPGIDATAIKQTQVVLREGVAITTIGKMNSLGPHFIASAHLIGWTRVECSNVPPARDTGKAGD